MRQNRFNRALIRRLAPLAVVATMALVAGCSAGPFSGPIESDAAAEGTSAPDAPAQDAAAVETSAGDDPANAGTATATLVMEGQSFTFSPTLCMVGDEDALVSGPGVDDGSQEPAYLDIDFYRIDLSWGGEVRVDLGTDRAMTSSDRFYSIRIGQNDEYMVQQVEHDNVAGETESGEGTLTVTCG
ncbi:MAG: hypothetical protein ABI255_06955 [Microbacteriaceae bacterium]